MPHKFLAVKPTERRRTSTWKRPDRQRAVQHRQEVETFTIKVGLNSLISDPKLRQLIEHTVRDLTQLQWEASKIVQLYVLDRIARDEALYKLDHDFFYRALVCATGSNTALLPDLWRARDELYTPQRAGNLPWVSRTLRTQLLKLTAITLRTNAFNHVVQNLHKRLRKWCALEVQRRLPELSSTWKSSLTHKFSAAICFGDNWLDVPHGLFEAHGFTQQGLDDVQNTLQLLLEAQGDLVPITSGKLQQRWQEYLPWLGAMLSDFQEEVRPRKSLLFSILPDKGFSATYISIDTSCLQELVKLKDFEKGQTRSKRKREEAEATEPEHVTDAQDPDEAKHAAKLATWRQWVMFTPLETVHHKFGCHISTDGVGASVTMERPKRGEPAAQPLILREGIRVMGVDPGVKDFFVASVQTPAGQPGRDKVVQCSTAEYYHRAGFTHAKAWREAKLHAARNFEQWQGGIPLSHTSSVRRLQQHVAYVTPQLERALQHHGTSQQRGMRWNCHQKKQRCLHLLAKRLTAGRPKEEVVIGWGNGSTGYGSCIKRMGRGPNKELVQLLRRQYARVEIIDEYKTSQVCSDCRSQVRPLQTADGKRPHAVRVCNHCHTVWNRDVNASRNMLCLLECQAAGQPRPAALRRPARGRPWHGGGAEMDELEDMAEAAAMDAAAEEQNGG